MSSTFRNPAKWSTVSAVSLMLSMIDLLMGDGSFNFLTIGQSFGIVDKNVIL